MAPGLAFGMSLIQDDAIFFEAPSPDSESRDLSLFRDKKLQGRSGGPYCAVESETDFILCFCFLMAACLRASSVLDRYVKLTDLWLLYASDKQLCQLYKL